MVEDILTLSWKLQFSLAAGYAVYLATYRGIRASHNNLDVVFMVLVLGAMANGILWQMEQAGAPYTWANTTVAFSATLVLGLLWRRWGRKLVGSFFRCTGISHSDDTKTAWEELADRPDLDMVQLSVELIDGRILHCDNFGKYSDAAIPSTLGADGAVLMYLDKITEADREERPQSTTIDDAHGDRVTYVPKSQIKRLNIRYKKSLKP